LGVDEISQKKRHRQFVLVLIDHTNARVLDVLPERDKGSFVEWLRRGKQSGLLAHLVEVTTDRWEGYINAVHEVFGKEMRVTIDRFHVMKQFQERLTQARREIQRKLPKEEAKALKGSRWLWVKNAENLSKQEQERLQELKEKFPELEELAQARENLRSIFEDRGVQSAQEGKKRLQGWMKEVEKLGLKALKEFSRTLTRWLDGIANYFATRSSNGRTEGFNHGLRSILWRAFGMQNFENFRQRVLDRFGRPASC
jgi:transposase